TVCHRRSQAAQSPGRLRAFVAPFLRHSPAGSRRSPPHDPKAPGSQADYLYDGLSASDPPEHQGCVAAHGSALQRPAALTASKASAVVCTPATVLGALRRFIPELLKTAPA